MRGTSSGSRAAAAAAVVVVMLTSACGAREAADRRSVTSHLERDVPDLVRSEAWQGVTDLGTLSTPSTGIRTSLASTGTLYRVINADPERAEVALWRRAAPAPEPFNANRVAVGSTCAEFHRRTGQLQAAVIPCPSELPDEMPDAEAPVWDRAAGARTLLMSTSAAVGFDVKWALFRNEDGTQPRTETRTAKDIRDAIERTNVPGTRLVVGDVTEHDRRVHGSFRLTATAGDAVDVTRNSEVTGCFDVTVDLTWSSVDGHENWSPVSPTVC